MVHDAPLVVIAAQILVGMNNGRGYDIPLYAMNQTVESIQRVVWFLPVYERNTTEKRKKQKYFTDNCIGSVHR